MRVFFNRCWVVSASDVAGGVFILQRSLSKSLRFHVLAGSGLTLEKGEILFELHLAGSPSSATNADAEGYIPSRDLLAALSYSAGLLSRRLGWLVRRGWAEMERATPNIAKGLHGNCQKVRITAAGKSVVAPVWQKYEDVMERLLRDISLSDLAAHYRVNELISDKLSTQSWIGENQNLMEKRSIVVRPEKILPTNPSAPPTARKPQSPIEPAPRKYLLDPPGEFLD